MAWLILVPFVIMGAIAAFIGMACIIGEIFGRLLGWLEDHVAVPW